MNKFDAGGRPIFTLFVCLTGTGFSLELWLLYIFGVLLFLLLDNIKICSLWELIHYQHFCTTILIKFTKKGLPYMPDEPKRYEFWMWTSSLGPTLSCAQFLNHPYKPE